MKAHFVMSVMRHCRNKNLHIPTVKVPHTWGRLEVMKQEKRVIEDHEKNFEKWAETWFANHPA